MRAIIILSIKCIMRERERERERDWMDRQLFDYSSISNLCVFLSWNEYLTIDIFAYMTYMYINTLAYSTYNN